MDGAKCAYSGLNTRFCGRFVHHIHIGEDAVVGPELGDHRLPRILIQVKNNDLAARRGDPTCHRLTDARGTPGDDGNFSIGIHVLTPIPHSD